MKRWGFGQSAHASAVTFCTPAENIGQNRKLLRTLQKKTCFTHCKAAKFFFVLRFMNEIAWVLSERVITLGYLRSGPQTRSSNHAATSSREFIFPFKLLSNNGLETQFAVKLDAAEMVASQVPASYESILGALNPKNEA